MTACVFPPRCPVCGGLRIPWESNTCTDCAAKLRFIKEPVCMCCGREISEEGKEYCSRCEEARMSFERNFAVWQYDKRMKKSIAGFKYDGRKEYVDFYIRHMAGSYGKQLLKYGVTVLVPVPISRKRRRFRGFNQTELLADALAKELGITSAKLIKRVKSTPPLSGLSPTERMRTLRDAFCWDEKEALKQKELPHTVALVDDIFTTGTTMEACTHVLTEKGISSVYGICICIGND